MSTEQQVQDELTDVALCYQAMGVPLDASPAEIEKMYKSLTEEYTKKLASADPVLREEARVSLELLGVMYEKIRNSITYRAMENDHNKKKSADDRFAGELKRPAHFAAAQQRNMTHCPRCNGSISKAATTCPICKAPIYTALQKVLNHFTPKRLVLYGIIIAVVSLAVAAIMNPDLVSQITDRFSTKTPELEFPNPTSK
jgi:rubrerythrin